MGLAKRIIPTMLVRGRQLVKGKQFNAWRSVGHAVQAVRIHQARGVDELVLLDIAATREGRGPNLKLVEELTKDCFMPLAVGGGVRTVEDVKDLLRAGADKVVIGTRAYEDEEFIRCVSGVVGRQAIVAAIDYSEPLKKVHTRSGREEVRLHGFGATIWLPAASAAEQLEEMGAGEILLTSIEREGTMQGYDLDLIRHVSNAVSIPVIAHGGCGTPHHMLEAIEAGADAVAAGAIFAFTDVTPAECARYLALRGVETRIAA